MKQNSEQSEEINILQCKMLLFDHRQLLGKWCQHDYRVPMNVVHINCWEINVLSLRFIEGGFSDTFLSEWSKTYWSVYRE